MRVGDLVTWHDDTLWAGRRVDSTLGVVVRVHDEIGCAEVFFLDGHLEDHPLQCLTVISTGSE